MSKFIKRRNQPKRIKRMRYLHFTDDNKLYHNIIYETVLNNQKGYDKKQVRVVASILDKLESVAVANDTNGFTYKGGNQTVVLDDGEFQLLSENLDGVQWHAKFARQALKLIDWFATTPTGPKVEAIREEATEVAAPAV